MKTSTTDRKAICGACGCERTVDSYMKKRPEFQFTSRPTKPTDLFYCGCEGDPDWLEWCP